MIHPSAVIAKNAEIHETTHIGPFCIIGDGVKIGENLTISGGIVSADDQVTTAAVNEPTIPNNALLTVLP